MKALFFLFFTGIVVMGNCQIPNNYYQPAEGKGGLALKTALYQIIKGHKSYEYTSDTTDVWDILKQTDRDPANPANVIEIYSGWSVNAAQEYNSGNGWEREHVWAKVHGGFGTDMGPGTDVHHLRPIDGSVNSARNSRWFSTCDVPYSVNGNPTGSFTSTTSYVWEPRPEDRGDVARMIFYMAVRYEGENGEPNLEIVDSIPTNNNDPAPIMAKLSDLLVWNLEDTVDDRERNRNDIIYYQFQHNRNPFIDHPEYALRIWGADSLSAGISACQEDAKLLLFPNPVRQQAYLYSSFSHYPLSFDIANQYGQTIFKGYISGKEQLLHLEGLKPGLYFLSFQEYGQKLKVLKIR